MCDYNINIYIYCLYIYIYMYINIVRERITIYLSKMFDMFLKDDSTQQRTEDPTFRWLHGTIMGPEFS